ncbi:hypothetical protein HPB49_006858 [Dermacentor silvarum]|uniref:Uncharacterized protein n=1 Tax=Dermacentor silvarum TaxID=543639 RepID=A0ACB8CJK8_DERSI|nr:hypothetical protein HPB49_006858 [Dermacentor silvarum]
MSAPSPKPTIDLPHRLALPSLRVVHFPWSRNRQCVGRAGRGGEPFQFSASDGGRISDAPYKRHPRATTSAQDMDILDAAQASPFSTAKEIGAGAGVSASVSTIKRQLAEGKLRSHVAAQKPRLSEANEASPFTTRWDQKQRVWRRVKARYDPVYVQEGASCGRTAVNFEGAMSRD